MEKLLNVAEPQSPNDNTHSMNDPLAVGIEESLWRFRLAPSRLPGFRRPTANKNENANENTSNRR
jgi:hypothetical protein